jgi:hypothetical protein
MDIEVLKEDRLRYWCSRIEIPDGAADELAQKAREIYAEPQLMEIFTSFYKNIVLPGNWHTEWDAPLQFDPHITERYGEAGTTMFYLLAYMSGLPAVEQMYIRRGISLDIFHDTLLDIRIWLLRAYEEHHLWRFGQFQWIALHLQGLIFRLGRLQFALRDYDDHVHAFRHRETCEIMLLCGPEIPLRADGYALGAGRADEDLPVEGEGWHAIFEETENGWRGNRVVPLGYALREPVFLSKTEWEVALQKGDTLLDFHIPRGEKMTMEECRESLRRGYEFFEWLEPERKIKAGFCHTWFFTPQIQKFLPLESNIVRFQREFYLFPYPGTPGFLWDYTFGKWIKPETAPGRCLTGSSRAVSCSTCPA